MQAALGGHALMHPYVSAPEADLAEGHSSSSVSDPFHQPHLLRKIAIIPDHKIWNVIDDNICFSAAGCGGGGVHVKRTWFAQVSAEVAGLPAVLLGTRVRRVAVCDFLTRAFGAVIARAGADARAQAGGWHGEVVPLL